MTADGLLPTEPGAAIMSELATFTRYARSRGLRVSVAEAANAADALAVLGLGRSDALRWALRMAMCKSPTEHALFDAVFEEYWYGRHRVRVGAPDEEQALSALPDVAEPPAHDAGIDTEDPSEAATYSATELLRRRDFALYSDVEWAEVRRLMAQLKFGGPWRRSRRVRPMRDGHLDLRRTLRMSMRTQGEPLHLAYKDMPLRQRRIVLACDISGSMEPYSRALLQFMHSAVGGRRRVEAFVFATRLTRLTDALGIGDPEEALHSAADEVGDWAGGTRIGAAIGTLNRRHHGAVHGAVVVIVSDGWDTGRREQLDGEMMRLARLARRVVWLNPLKYRPGFAPITQGMATAMPYVDDFLEGHSIASFEQLICLLDEIGPRGARKS